MAWALFWIGDRAGRSDETTAAAKTYTIVTIA
jgi:hypothetical protein